MANDAQPEPGTPVQSSARSLMGRLRDDRAGNVLAIAAACIPPILILVGGGIDMSRAYMTQTSLQAACDAGVLAGRRAQAKSGNWTWAEQDKADRMFKFNFQGATAGASNTVFTPIDAGGGVISGTATTTIPTVIMQLFGTTTFNLTAKCSAEFQISNIDVMMVLDTTGSMKCDVNGYNCNSGSSSKIVGLQDAIRSFYTTIATAVPSGGTTRVRFGFVPYSSAVNMQELFADADLPASYLTSSTNYQTKLANFDTPNYIASPGSPSSVNRTSSQSKKSNCTSWASGSATTGGPAPAATTTTTYSYVSYDSKTDVCTRKETTVTSTYTQSGFKFTDWRYTQSAVDTSSLKTFASVPIATSISSSATVPTAGRYDLVQLGSMSGTTGISTTNITWNGCVEERDTVNSLFSGSTAPSGAFDHDLTSAPSNTATTWHPYIGNLEFDRGQTATLDTSTNISSEAEKCPVSAKKFTTVDTSNPATVPSWLETYISSLAADGNTYHDLGMMWGARLGNPNGIMATNVNEGNLTAISRHIIMMTDGEMKPNRTVYSSYGLERYDNRVAPSGTSDTSLTNFHNARFLTACQTAKNMGYTIWFIAFGTSLSTEMTTCATPGHAFFAGDSASLANTFRHIASQVADLRLHS